MPFVHGKDAVIKLHDGTALRDLTAGGASVQFDQSKDTAETTTFADEAKRYIAGLKDANFSLDGPRDATLTGYVRTAYNQPGVVAFEYFPEGTATGRLKLSGNCIITGLSENSGVDDANRWSAEGQVDGDVTAGTVP